MVPLEHLKHWKKKSIYEAGREMEKSTLTWIKLAH